MGGGGSAGGIRDMHSDRMHAPSLSGLPSTWPTDARGRCRHGTASISAASTAAGAASLRVAALVSHTSTASGCAAGGSVFVPAAGTDGSFCGGEGSAASRAPRRALARAASSARLSSASSAPSAPTLPVAIVTPPSLRPPPPTWPFDALAKPPRTAALVAS